MKTLARAVALALVCAAQPAGANPEGGTFIQGSGTLVQQGAVMTVTNSPNAILNWQGFSIAPDETTRFVQQGADSAVLNRVLGNDPSMLLGALESNGRVFLVNPSGIVVGEGARIDVAGLVATTLGYSNADFLAGRMDFTALSGAAGIQNAGRITTPEGGQVYLLAPEIENRGLIRTPGGETVLAAGETVHLIDSATPGVRVAVTGSNNTATNLGQILADSGRIGLVGATVRNAGTLNAGSLVRDGGRIFLKAGGRTVVEDGSVLTSASAAGRGGVIHLLGDEVALQGAVDVDASGTTAGGEVLVGGDYRGGNPQILNAQQTTLSAGSVLRADATEQGDGGKVVVWAEDSTVAEGSLSAQGGASGGNGGLIEVSGKSELTYRGHASTLAPQGQAGMLLLDPGSATLIAGAGTNTANTFYGDNILTDLTNSPVVISTDNTGSGDITFTAGTYNFTNASSNSLTLLAYGDATSTGNIQIPTGTSITMASTAPLFMLAGWDGASTSVPIAATSVASTGGVLSLEAGASIDAGTVELAAAETVAVKGSVIGSVTYKGKNVDFIQDSLSLANATVHASNMVSISPATTASQLIVSNTDLGCQICLWLDPNQFGNMTAPVLRLGDSTRTASLSIESPVNYSGNQGANGQSILDLQSSGAISQATGATVSANAISFYGGSVSMPEANPVGVVAGLALNGDFLYHTVNLLTVSSVGTMNRIEASGNIRLESDDGINQSGAAFIYAPNGLALVAAKKIDLPGTNVVGTLAASVANQGEGMGFTLQLPPGASASELLTVGSVSAGGRTALSGITTNGGYVSLISPQLNISAPVAANGGYVGIRADALSWDGSGTGSISTSSQGVEIVTNTANLPIQVGVSSSTACIDFTCLALGDLHKIDAPVLVIGSDGSVSGLPVSGAISVAGVTRSGPNPPVTDIHANTQTLVLHSGAGVTQIADTGYIRVNNLAISAGGTVDLSTAPNMVTSLAGKTSAGDFLYQNGASYLPRAINVASLNVLGYSLSGISAAGNLALDAWIDPMGGGAAIITASGTVLEAKNGTATMSAHYGGLILGNGSQVRATGNIVATATEDATLSPGSVMQSSGGSVSMTSETGSVSAGSGISGAAPLVSGTGITLTASNGAVTFPLPGTIYNTNGATISASSWVSASAANGITLNGALTGLDATNTLSGDITVNGTGTGLQVTMVQNQSSTGGVTIKNAGAITLPDSVVSASGPVLMIAGAPSSSNPAHLISIAGAVSGSSVTLGGYNVTGNIPTGATLQIYTPPPPPPPAGPTLTECIANPTLSGCSTVLPSTTDCTANPSATGCSVVLPSLSECTATPTLAGCSVVLPALTDCVATPTLAGCTVVLPSTTDCTTNPSAAGCSVVLPSLSECTATPTLAGCSVVLPALTDCVATPTLAGCTVVLPSTTDCTANPSATGCSVVLPSLSDCTATPTLAGCSVVLPALTDCVATPTLAGCTAVLPTLGECTLNSTLAGCSAVLPTLTSCISSPGQAGCAAVLPPLSTCTVAPSVTGCAVVLPPLSLCTIDPEMPGCLAVLPTLAACTSNASLPGCTAVLPSLVNCETDPDMPGCTAVLPDMTSCTLDPDMPGCEVVLPSLATCMSNATLPGCAVVLPSLASCTLDPDMPGCASVLPHLVECTQTPTMAGCSVVLPSLAFCTQDPTLPGCTAVLPSLTVCTSNPGVAGCSAVLPSMTVCLADSAVAGCTAVLPSAEACLQNPDLLGCIAVAPATQGDVQEVVQGQQNTLDQTGASPDGGERSGDSNTGGTLPAPPNSGEQRSGTEPGTLAGTSPGTASRQGSFGYEAGQGDGKVQPGGDNQDSGQNGEEDDDKKDESGQGEASSGKGKEKRDEPQDKPGKC